jgi:hypothetical protein
MKYLALYILLSFIGIAVLGFTGMVSQNSLFSRCVEATIPGGLPCGGQDTSLNTVRAAIYQSFSAAVAAVLVLLAIAFVSFSRVVTLQTRAQIFSIISKLEAKHYSSTIKYNRWSEFCQQHPSRA